MNDDVVKLTKASSVTKLISEARPRVKLQAKVTILREFGIWESEKIAAEIEFSDKGLFLTDVSTRLNWRFLLLTFQVHFADTYTMQ